MNISIEDSPDQPVFSTPKSDLNPLYIIAKNAKLMQSMVIVKGSCAVSKEAQANARVLFNLQLMTELNSKKLILDDRLNKEAYDFLFEEIYARFKQSIVHPGEMVGSIAA